MSAGFKKGKIPERFEGKTDEQLAVMQYIMWNPGKIVVEEIEGKITAHLMHYFDDELAAVQIIKKNERIEKALDKACEQLTIEAFLCHSRSKAEWKEWCMKDEDR